MDVIRPSGFADCKVQGRFLCSLGDWETGALSFLMMVFQRDGCQVLEKDIPGL